MLQERFAQAFQLFLKPLDRARIDVHAAELEECEKTGDVLEDVRHPLGIGLLSCDGGGGL